MGAELAYGVSPGGKKMEWYRLNGAPNICLRPRDVIPRTNIVLDTARRRDGWTVHVTACGGQDWIEILG